MQGISSNALSFGSPNNNYKFNDGDEWEESINLYSTFFRGYDQQLGRFNGVDILGEQSSSISPYQFGANNPVTFNDPSGALLKDPSMNEPPPHWIWNDVDNTLNGIDRHEAWMAGMADLAAWGSNGGGGESSSAWTDADDNLHLTGDAARNLISALQEGFEVRYFQVYDKNGKEIGFICTYNRIVDPYDYAKEGIPPSDQLGGLQVLVGYISCSSDSPQTNDLNWIQRVKTNSILLLGQKPNEWFTDQTPDAKREGVPYYTTNEYIRRMVAEGGDVIKDPSGCGNYIMLFNDRISRYVADGGSNYLNINWTANLSLVTIKDNSPLIVLSYGFTISNGVVTPISFTQIPSSH